MTAATAPIVRRPSAIFFFSAAIISVITLCFGCRAKRTDDRPIDDDVDRDAVLKEQKRVNKGEVVGAALLTPKIVVDPEKITCNGYRVGPRSDIDKGGKLTRVDSMFSWAKGLREHWKQIHPGQDFEGNADITLPTDVSFTDGASLAITLAYAGYPRSMSLHAGEVTATIDVYTPGPPRVDDEVPRKEPRVELWRDVSSDASDAWSTSTYTNTGVGMDRLQAIDDAKRFGMIGLLFLDTEKIEPPKPTCSGAPRNIPTSQMTVELQKACDGGECVVSIGGAKKWRDAALALRGAPASHKPMISIRFISERACPPSP